MRPLLLHEHAVPGHARIVDPGGDRLGQLIRHAVIESVREVLIVREPGPIVGHKRVLIADLEAVRTRDVGGGPLPQVGTRMRDAEILRPVHQARNVPVRRTAARALLGHTNEIARGIRLTFEIAHAEEGSAITCFEKQVMADR